jgi:hypothetical protein
MTPMSLWVMGGGAEDAIRSSGEPSIPDDLLHRSKPLLIARSRHRSIEVVLRTGQMRRTPPGNPTTLEQHLRPFVEMARHLLRS